MTHIIQPQTAAEGVGGSYCTEGGVLSILISAMQTNVDMLSSQIKMLQSSFIGV